MASSLLKCFFRELPEPVLTFKLYSAVCGFNNLGQSALVPTISKLLSVLPATNQELLAYILDLLVQVMQLSDKNKMTANNIAIVFGPNLVWSDTEKVSINTMQQVNLFTTLLIESYHRDPAGLLPNAKKW